MKNRVLLSIIILIAGIFGFLIGRYSIYLNSFTGWLDVPPSFSQSAFVENCATLNGEELTLQNVKKLKGWCFIDGGMNECKEENIVRLKNMIDPFFNVYHNKQGNQVDNTWICVISGTDGDKIKAIAYYQYE